jgi:zinc and cadmium transporter
MRPCHDRAVDEGKGPSLVFRPTGLVLLIVLCLLTPGLAHDSPHVTEEASAHALKSSSSEAWPLVLLSGYCVLLIGAALFGGWATQHLNLSHTKMQTIMSFVGGLMLGIAVFHMLPHSVMMLGEGGMEISVNWLAGGLLVMFFLLRFFHFHQHGPGEVSPRDEHEYGDCKHPHPLHEHGHDSDGTNAACQVLPSNANKLSWVGVFLGLALHTLIDGLALGASVEADASHGIAGLLGVGTFLAIFLHIPLDSVSITAVMTAGGCKPFLRNLTCATFAIICPLGAALFVFGVHRFTDQQPAIIGCALAFSAGVFLCIALGDLLPEMEFHSHNRVQLSLALLFGVAIAWGIGFVEPEYVHSHRDAKSGHTHFQAK